MPRVARTEDRTVARTEAEERLWNVEDVGAYLGIPSTSVYKMTGRKASVHIPHIRISGRLRFRRADIDRWLTLLTVGTLEGLSKVRQRFSKEKYGNYPRANAP